METGRKADIDKLRTDLISPESMEALASILTYGASKYNPRNWEIGIEYGRVYAAMQRHLLAWLKGESIDPESGLPHIDHAFCNLMFLVTYEARGMSQYNNLTQPNQLKELFSGYPVYKMGEPLKEFENVYINNKITDSGHSIGCK